ncbi:LuxR C-terminal-related transcriptional regulator [Gordonia caeni]|uniref:Helix-turn-helix transcriptional regulator n=1 Tax=Gordonia caeni TaxID=1007097 RepID=A0ABP7PG77_9ACTN
MSETPLEVPVTDALRRIRRSSGVSLAFGGVVTGQARLLLKHFVGTTKGALSGLSVDTGHGLGGKVLTVTRPMVVNDYLETPQITHRYNEAIATEGLRAVAAAPVIVERRVVAVLYGALHSDNPLGGRALDTLTTEARVLEQEIAASRAVLESEACVSPDVDGMRDAMALAYTRLRLLARTVDDDQLSDEIARITEGLLEQPGRGREPLISFTGREQDVLSLAALGYPNARIAGELGVTVETAKGYMKAAMRKLGAGTRLEAVVLARRAGVLPG